MKRTKIKELLKTEPTGQTVLAQGWVQFNRNQKEFAFITLNDGSIMTSIQIVADKETEGFDNVAEINRGACIGAIGRLIESPGSGQAVEIKADKLIVYGHSPEDYPIQKKAIGLEKLREMAHMRIRTNVFAAVFRVRNALAYGIHKFFQDKGFAWVHTPIITGSDTEGAGEMFQVTTLDLNNVPKNEDGEVDFTEDFFGKQTHLTVSGQLNGELYALALAEIYTFGPTFRAEKSNTSRHLAEFWMMEPEMAFYDNDDNQDLVEEMCRFLISYALEQCPEDIEFLAKRLEKEESAKPKHQRQEMGLMERLRFVADNDFQRITYTEAFDILRNSKPNKKKKFNFLVQEWGMDLQSEHERYLAEKHFKRPVIVTDYPKDIKAFYMKQNDDGKTVRGLDVLFPGIGEIVGGSQREEDMEKLMNRIEELNLAKEDYWWYLDTRKFGTAPHSGFGLGFERFVQFVTGMPNIRDVIPFPRTTNNAEF